MIRGLGVVAAVVAIAQPPRSLAQSTPVHGPEFEVASVRPIVPPAGRSNPCNIGTKPLNLATRISGNRFTLRSETLGGLIRDAYNLRDDQFTGLPDWADCKDQYEITAKTPGEETPTTEPVRLMLQALLADRFQLRVHHESKNLTVYELTVAKDGPKVKLVSERTVEGNFVNPWGLMTLLIEGNLDYPLVDKTGLKGFFPTTSNGITPDCWKR
jgi:hypothetical protein